MNSNNGCNRNCEENAMPMQTKIKFANPMATMPIFATEKSAGADLVACLDSKVTIYPGTRALIQTGVAVALPKDSVGLVFGRSGLARKNGICLANGVGVIDEDYRGEISVVLYNAGGHPFVVENGMRIAQLVVMPRLPVQLVKVDWLDETERGEDGFGSTGVAVSTPKRCGKAFEQQLNEIWDEMLHGGTTHE